MGRTAKPWFYRQTGWWMVWLDGKKEKLAKGRKNRKVAEQRLLELRFEATRNPAPEVSEQTVASIIETYWGFAEKRLAESTLAVRNPYLQSFAEMNGWRTVAECKPFHMESWLNSHPEWISDWTKSSAIRNVQVAFNWAVKSGILSANPFRGVSHRAGDPRRDMTRAEFLAILRATRRPGKVQPTPSARFREIAIFLWYTGCRPKEACQLRWSEVDFEHSVITLRHHKTSRTQRRAMPRIVPVHPYVAKILQAIKRRNEGEVVFLTHRLTPWTKNTLGQRTKRAREIAGVPHDAKLYGIRHAFGTRGIINGCDIKTLAELMGHTTTRMTEHYLHLAGQREHLAAAMRRVNGHRRDA